MPGIEPWLLGILMKVKGERILDIGAGLGFWGFMIKTRIGLNNLVVGLDVSSDKLTRLKTLNIYDDLIHADARYLPFHEKTFDLILSVETIHRFLERDLLMYYEKVLTPNGVIILAFPASKKIIGNLLSLGYDIYGVFHVGFLSGGIFLINIRSGEVVMQPTKSIVMRTFALILKLIYSPLKLKITHYCFAMKINKAPEHDPNK